MSWKNFSNNAVAIEAMRLDEAIASVTKVVRFYRWRGAKLDTALHLAALDLGITQRRARSLYNRELQGIKEGEHRGIVEAYLAHVAAKVAALRAEAVLLEEQSQEALLRRRQSRPQLGVQWPSSCFSKTGGGSGSHGSGSRSGGGTGR